MVTRERVRTVTKFEKVLSRVSRSQAVRVTKWVPRTEETPIRKLLKNGKSREVIVRRKTYQPVTYIRWIQGRQYYKILPRKEVTKRKTKVYRKKIRYFVPREAWGEHAYTMTLQRKRQGLCYFQTWVNYPTEPAVWVQYSCTPEAVAGIPNIIHTWDDNDDIAIVNRLRVKMLGSGFHAGKFLAEAGQTVHMIGDTARRITQSYILAKRGQFAASLRTLANARTTPGSWKRLPPTAQRPSGSPIPFASLKPKNGSSTREGRSSKGPIFSTDVPLTASNFWLEWSYGVAPLLQDTKDAAEALSNFCNIPRRAAYSATLNRYATVHGSATFSYRAGGITGKRIKAIVQETDLPQLSGLTDVMSGLWEATPWSFVADWFIPIGSYLEARGMAQAVSGTFVTTKKVSNYRGAISFSGYSPIYKSDGPWDHEDWDLTLTRTISTSLAVPMPKAVGLSEVISGWKRATNAVTLLVQQLRKR